MEWTGKKYNEYYEYYMPTIENKYLSWFTNDNKASYTTKETMKTDPTGGVTSSLPGVGKLQEGVADTVGGQLGTGGLGEGVGKLASKEGVDRAETGGGEEGKQAQGMLGGITGGKS